MQAQATLAMEVGQALVLATQATAVAQVHHSPTRRLPSSFQLLLLCLWQCLQLVTISTQLKEHKTYSSFFTS